MNLTSVHQDVTPNHHYEHVQGVRAIAVIAVLLYHAGLPVPGGFTGVDIFFVVSGFVIMRQVARQLDANSFTIGNFFVRRFWRLAPALACVLLLTTVSSLLLLPPFGIQQTVFKTSLLTPLLAANIAIDGTSLGYFDAGSESNSLLHLWSLSVEEQFYLGFALLILVLSIIGQRYRRRNLIAGAFALVGIGSFMGMLTLRGNGLSAGQLDNLFAFYSPIGRVWEFSSGILLALAAGRTTPLTASPPRNRLSDLSGLAGVALLCISMFAIDESFDFPGPTTLLPVCSSILLMVCGLRGRSLVSRLLSSKPLKFVGDRSYSIYLWHWPFVSIGSQALGTHRLIPIAMTILSFIPALYFYKSVEQPLRTRAEWPRRRTIAIGTLLISVPALLSAGLLFSSNRSYWNDEIRKIDEASSTNPSTQPPTCANSMSSPDFLTSPDCLFNNDFQATPIYLIGDSNAAQFADGLVVAGSVLQRPVGVISRNGCPAILGGLQNEFLPGTECLDFTTSLVASLSKAAPGDVIISNSGGYWGNADLKFIRSPLEGSTSEVGSTTFESGLNDLIEILVGEGHGVYLMQQIPYLGPEATPSSCALVSVLLSRCGGSEPLQVILDNQKVSRDGITSTADEMGVGVLDPVQWICESGTCPSSRNEVILYRDGGHLSVLGARELAAKFVEVFAK